MKLIFLSISCAIILTSCADSKSVNGKTYDPYGLISEDEEKVPGIHYKFSIQAAFSGVLFSELLFIPTVYTFGYNLYEPVCTEEEFQKDKMVLKP